MIENIKYSLFIIVHFVVIFGYSQEPVFSQFYDNPIYLNPALAGQYKLRVSSNLNSQWINTPGFFNTQSISIDGRYEPKSFSDRPNAGEIIYGCYFLNNSEGELSLKNQQYAMLLGFRLRVNKRFKVSMPIQGAFGTRSINLSSAVFRQNLDPVLGNINSSNFILPYDNFYSYVNFNTGFNVTYTNSEKSYDKKLDFGFALHNLLTTEREGFMSSNNISRRKLTAYASLLKKELYNSDFRFSLFYQNQFSLQTIQAAMQFYPSRHFTTENKRNIYIGSGLFFRGQMYSTNIATDAAKFIESIYLPLFILNSNPSFTMKTSFSYGLTISELLQPNSGGICEISIQIINNSDNYWDICPGDRGFRKDLGKNKKRIKSKNKKKTKKKLN